jgi:hypothetical protein
MAGAGGDRLHGGLEDGRREPLLDRAGFRIVTDPDPRGIGLEGHLHRLHPRALGSKRFGHRGQGLDALHLERRTERPRQALD